MKRNYRFTFLLSAIEFDQFNRLAIQLHRNRSDLIRWLIHMKAEEEGVFRRQVKPEDIRYQREI